MVYNLHSVYVASIRVLIWRRAYPNVWIENLNICFILEKRIFQPTSNRYQLLSIATGCLITFLSLNRFHNRINEPLSLLVYERISGNNFPFRDLFSFWYASVEQEIVLHLKIIEFPYFHSMTVDYLVWAPFTFST